MNKRCVVVSAAILVASSGLAQAQSFTEGFETTAAGAIPANWVQRNQSEPIGTDGQNPWFVAGAYNVIIPNTGAQQVICRWLSGDGLATLNSWLISPVVSLRNGDTFSFWTRMYSTTYPDRLQLRMSTAGVSTNTGTGAFGVGDFTTLLLDINPTYTTTGYPIVYTQFTVTVSGLAAETAGRFAFRYFVENGGPSGINSNVIGVDDVAYTYTGTVTTGACCLPSGACTANQTAAQCTAANGIFQGLSTVCGSCPQPGACCFGNGTCQTFTAAQCTVAGGIFRGDNTTCSPNLCEQPGACCLADGTCASLLTAPCAARTGVFRGAGTACGSPACPQPYIATSDVGETIATAAVVSGSGPLPGITGEFLGTEDVDMYEIQICDLANFRASVVTWTSGPTGAIDSMMFLFRPNGLGVVIDDDNPGTGVESTITNANIPAAGNYYLAISGWDNGPVGTAGNAATRIWATQSAQNSAPNGPGAAMPLGGWLNFGTDPTTGNPAATGFYTIAFNGACYVGTPTPCYANCDHSTTTPCLNVLDFSCFLNAFSSGASYANCDNSTTVPVLNVLDFSCFLNKFAAGCSSC